MSFTYSELTSLQLYQWLGLLGFCIYVVNYCCLSFRILSSESIWFFAINTTAAALVLISLMQDFNLASALIQTFWIVIGACAIVLRIYRFMQVRRGFRTPLMPKHGSGPSTAASPGSAPANQTTLLRRVA